MKSGTVAGEGAVQDGDHVQPGGGRAVDEGDACWRHLGQFCLQDVRRGLVPTRDQLLFFG